MIDCQPDVQLSAYHDGELDVAAISQVRRHLETCATCSAKLLELDRMSSLFAGDPAPRLSQIGLHRLHARVEYWCDSGLLRLARVMIGLAATVLIVGSLWLIQSRPPTPMAESVTQMALQLEEQPAAVAPDPGPSDWIVAELSH